MLQRGTLYCALIQHWLNNYFNYEEEEEEEVLATRNHMHGWISACQYQIISVM